jgi:hypothetical protein
MNNNKICSISKPGLYRNYISHLDTWCTYHYFPENTTYAVLFKEMLCSFIHGDGLNELLTFNKNNYNCFLEFCHFLLWDQFVKWECSYSPVTNLRWINSQISNMNIIHATAEALVRHTSIHTYRHRRHS